jgi:hypothetical protein
VHPSFQAQFRLRISSAIAAAKEVGAVEHPGLVGQLREILVRELLRPILPPSVGFGTGKIVDHLGNESRQVDVIVYDRSLMPPLLYGVEDVGLYPVEACLYAIEVKSKATAESVRDAIRNAASVGALEYAPEFSRDGVPIDRVIAALFAFGSTTRSGGNERDRLVESQSSQWFPIATDDGPVRVRPIRVACVVSRGYGYFEDRSFGWLDSPGDNDEVLWCIAGIANSLPVLMKQRFAFQAALWSVPR